MLVLASADDVTALGVDEALRIRVGETGVRFITGEELALAPCWDHRLGEGETRTRILLPDGTRLDEHRLGAIFNRLQVPDLPQFYGASEADRLYAIGEVAALWLSWLASLACPVVNPPSPWSLPGPEFPLLQWLDLASRAGLPARGCTFSSDPRVFSEQNYTLHRFAADGGSEPIRTPPFPREPSCFFEPVGSDEETVLVAGDRRVGRLGDQFSDGLYRLRALAGCDLLQVMFRQSVTTGEWLVTNATSFPVTDDPVSHRAIALVLTGEGEAGA